jgi:hypothetical protein
MTPYMKTIKRLAIIFIVLHLVVIISYAQSDEKQFVGTWELARQSYNNIPMKAPDGYLKIFNADKTFANMLMQNNKPITTHNGTYKIDGQYYLEKTLYRSPTMISNSPLGTDFKIRFEFNQEHTELTLNFTAANGIQVVEIWKKQVVAI